MPAFRSGEELDGLRIKYGEVYADWHGGGGGSLNTCDWGTKDDVIIVQVNRGKPG